MQGVGVVRVKCLGFSPAKIRQRKKLKINVEFRRNFLRARIFFFSHEHSEVISLGDRTKTKSFIAGFSEMSEDTKVNKGFSEIKKVEKGLDNEVECRSINLISNEGKEFLLSFKNARMSKLVEVACSDVSAKKLTLIQVSTQSLKLIVEYMKHHQGKVPSVIPTPLCSRAMSDHTKDKWCAQFIDGIGKNRRALYDLILAADYMDIKALLHLGCAKVAILIKDQPLEKMMHILNPQESRKKGRRRQKYRKKRSPEQKRVVIPKHTGVFPKHLFQAQTNWFREHFYRDSRKFRDEVLAIRRGSPPIETTEIELPYGWRGRVVAIADSQGSRIIYIVCTGFGEKSSKAQLLTHMVSSIGDTDYACAFTMDNGMTRLVPKYLTTGLILVNDTEHGIWARWLRIATRTALPLGITRMVWNYFGS